MALPQNTGFHPHTAMLLAAGLGTRMRGASDMLPKPLIALAGRALLDHALDRLAAAGVARAVINVHHKADLIEAHVARRTKPKILVSDERGALLETGGGVVKALPLIGSDPFVRHNSDAVWLEDVSRPNFPRLFAGYDRTRMDCLLLLAERATSLRYDGRGDFALEADGRIRRPLAGETVPYVFAGVEILDPKALEGAPSGAFSLNRIWDKAIASGRAYGLVLDGRWMHVGTPQALAEAEALIAASAKGSIGTAMS